MYPGVDVQQSAVDSSIRYVSGGIGEPGRSSLMAMQKDFNLKLMFADTKGPYLSDVNVTISDNKGQTLIDTVTDGPYLFAKLKPGTYRVKSTYQGTSHEQKVTVGSGGQKTANIFFKTNEM